MELKGTEAEAPLPELSPEEKRAQADKLVAEGKKAIALKQWEDGVGNYADALDLMRQLVGDFDPQMAPLLLSYGKALYELAFAQQGVMGKEEVDKQADDAVHLAGMDDTGAGGSSSNFVFSADPTSDDEDEGEGEGQGEEQTGLGDISIAQTAAAKEDGADEVDEPEDEYNAAWEVLDVARTIYAKIVEGFADGEGREESLCLAECFLALGDVSCETENFPQAVLDYTSALNIKSALLPPSSRALASVHYQIATVLEFTPDRRPDALSHVEKALSGFRERRAELSAGGGDISDEVSKLGSKEKEAEMRDVDGLIGDLEVKIEELKAAPPAEDLVSESINHLLGQSGSGEEVGLRAEKGKEDGPVNDLTGMVRKKAPKKDGKVKGVEGVNGNVDGNSYRNMAEGVNGEKRKGEGEEGSATKKARVE